MSSPTFETLRLTLANVRRRRRRMQLLQQSSLTLTGILLLIISLSLVDAWLNPSRSVAILFFLALLAGIAGLVWHFYRNFLQVQSDDRQVAHYVESRIPDLEQRLLTSLEFSSDELTEGRKGVSTQFIRQLWTDAEVHVRQQQEQVEHLETSRAPWISAGAAGAALVLVLTLFISSDALRRAGGHLLWPFSMPQQTAAVPDAETPVAPEIFISIEPGDFSMQRGESATIVARVENALPTDVQLRLQSDNVNWQNATMRQEGSGNTSATYTYFLPSVQQDTVYYVSFMQQGEHRSQQFRISLYDLPRVERVDVAYSYPRYTGWEDNRDENTGDLSLIHI